MDVPETLTQIAKLLGAFALGNFISVSTMALFIAPFALGGWLFWQWQVHVNYINNPAMRRRSPTIEAAKRLHAAYLSARATGWLSPQKNLVVRWLANLRKKYRKTKYNLADHGSIHSEEPPTD